MAAARAGTIVGNTDDSSEATGGTAGNLVTLDNRSVNEFYEERGIKGA